MKVQYTKNNNTSDNLSSKNHTLSISTKKKSYNFNVSTDKIISFIFGFLLIIAIAGYVFGTAFGMNTLIQYDSDLGIWKFNTYQYFLNISNTYSDFSSTITNNINFTNSSDSSNFLMNIVNGITSIINILLTPFQFVGVLLNMFMAVLGLPCDNSNWLWMIFHAFANFGIDAVGSSSNNVNMIFLNINSLLV